jgi:hypothetical protein
MNKVPVIRKGHFKDYFKPGCGLGIFVGGIGFWGYEYFERKKRIKKLKSGKYSFLDEESFQLHSDLFFEGTYKEYFIRILPMRKWLNARKEIEYDIVEAYYTFDLDNNGEKEKNLTGVYFLGELHFSNHCVGYIPKDWENPNFKNNLDGLISILKRENLKPFSKEEWESSFGKGLKEQQEKDEKARPKQVVKTGKLLDVKYKKKNEKAGS